MPELYFDIKFRADQSSKKTIADELNAIQQQADKAAQGSSETSAKQTKATQAQANAEKELIKEFQRRVTLNEVQFRQGKLSQDQALQQANAIEEWAQSQNILNNETLQGARAQKTMFLSQQRISTGFTGVAASSARANQSLINLGRIVQDLPFGFLGISNNIDPALTSLRQLKDESGGTVGAFRLLLGALKGPGGIIFALGSLLPTAMLISQRGWNMYSKKTTEAADSTSKLRDNIQSFISESSRLRGSDSFLNVRNLEAQAGAIRRLDEAMEAIKKGVQDVTQANREYALISADVTPFQNKFKDALDASESSLEAIEERFGLTSEDVEILKDRMEELNGELRRARAIASQDPLAQFSDGMERATDIFIQLAEAGRIQERQLLETAEGYREEMRVLLPYVGINDELTKKYNILNDERQRLLDTYKEITVALPDETSKVDLQADAIERLADRRKRDNDERERQIRQMKLLEDMPGAEGGVDETRALAAQAMVESIRSDVAIGAAEGLAQKRLEIERQFEEKRIQIIKQFGTETEAVREALGLLEIQQQQAIEKAKTDVVREEVKNRKKLEDDVARYRLQVQQNVLNALTSLSQGFAEDNKGLAIAILGVEKALAIAEVIIQGKKKAFEATAKGFALLASPDPLSKALAGQAFAMAGKIKALTALNVASIAAQGLGEGANIVNRGSRSAGTSAGGDQRRGFFESDPQRRQDGTPVYISLSGEFDDEMVSVKAERGDNKRMRGTFFPI